MFNTNLAENIYDELIVANNLHDDIEKDISAYSSTSKYEDNEWILDLYFKKENIKAVIRKYDFCFVKDDELKQGLKKYVYRSLLNGISITSLYNNFYSLRYFIRNMEVSNLEQIDHECIENYYRYLMDRDMTQSSRCVNWENLKRFLNLIEHKMGITMNLYSMEYERPQRKDYKYIPDEVAKQLDKFLKEDEDIPVINRLAYWLLRLYPGRATETFSCPVNCLKLYKDKIYVLSLTVFKTAGSEEGIPKLILIDTEDPIQKFLYDLIKKQQKIAKKIHKEHPGLGDFLFVGYRAGYSKKSKRWVHTQVPFVMKPEQFNYFLAIYIKRKNIMYGDKLAHVSSHMFRHNATTDRVESTLFRPIDLRPLTLHANEEMFNKSYHHKSDEQIINQAHNIEEIITGETLIFKGKVINSMDDRAFDYFLKNPFAFSLNNMGICADSRACDKDKLQCLECNFFIPSCDNLGYFEEQLEEWKKKLIVAEKMKNDIYKGNVEYNISLYKKVIEKIKKQIGKE